MFHAFTERLSLAPVNSSSLALETAAVFKGVKRFPRFAVPPGWSHHLGSSWLPVCRVGKPHSWLWWLREVDSFAKIERANLIDIWQLKNVERKVFWYPNNTNFRYFFGGVASMGPPNCCTCDYILPTYSQTFFLPSNYIEWVLRFTGFEHLPSSEQSWVDPYCMTLGVSLFDTPLHFDHFLKDESLLISNYTPEV